MVRVTNSKMFTIGSLFHRDVLHDSLSLVLLTWIMTLHIRKSQAEFTNPAPSLAYPKGVKESPKTTIF